jgi:outer membrane protein assembly factor BamB
MNSVRLRATRWCCFFVSGALLSLVAAVLPTTTGFRAASASTLELAASGASAVPSVAPPSTPGVEVWDSHFNPSPLGESQNSAQALAVSPDGSRVYVTGRSVPSLTTGATNYGTVAYSAATGSQLWATSFAAGTSWDAGGRAIALSPTGLQLFVTGHSYTGAVTVAYNALTGAELWRQALATNGEGSALAVSPDSTKVVVTGSGRDSAGKVGYATSAYSTATGALAWSSYYVTTGYAGGASGVVFNPSGSAVFITGSSPDLGSLGNTSFATIAYDAARGVQIWVGRYQGYNRGSETARTIAISPDGSHVFVTGTSPPEDGEPYLDELATVAYDAVSGAQLWVGRYHGPARSYQMIFSGGLCVSPDGTTLFVSGDSHQENDGGMVTLAYDASTGVQRWVQRHAGAGTGIAVSPNGLEVFVGGYSPGGLSGNRSGATAVAYTSGGAELWDKRSDDVTMTTGGIGSAIAVSPIGAQVFEVGFESDPISLGSPNGYDYATLAFAAA